MMADHIVKSCVDNAGSGELVLKRSNLKRSLLIPAVHSLSNKPLCQTLSNAFSRSRPMRAAFFLFMASISYSSLSRYSERVGVGIGCQKLTTDASEIAMSRKFPPVSVVKLSSKIQFYMEEQFHKHPKEKNDDTFNLPTLI